MQQSREVGPSSHLCKGKIEQFLEVSQYTPNPVAVRPKAWDCGYSLVGIVGSNLAGSMDVCLWSVVFCQGWLLVQSSPTDLLYLSVIVKPRKWGDTGPQAAVCSFMELQPPVVQCLLIHEVSRSHTTSQQSAGLLWTSDQPVAETSTWQHTTLTTDKHPCPRRDSKPQSQQASGRRPTP